MKSTGTILATIIIASPFATQLHCSPAERRAVRDAVGDIAAEVCLDADPVEVCLKKCIIECELRRQRGPVPESSAETAP